MFLGTNLEKLHVENNATSTEVTLNILVTLILCIITKSVTGNKKDENIISNQKLIISFKLFNRLDLHK